MEKKGIAIFYQIWLKGVTVSDYSLASLYFETNSPLSEIGPWPVFFFFHSIFPGSALRRFALVARSCENVNDHRFTILCFSVMHLSLILFFLFKICYRWRYKRALILDIISQKELGYTAVQWKGQKSLSV